jgi:hypothetical protein
MIDDALANSKHAAWVDPYNKDEWNLEGVDVLEKLPLSKRAEPFEVEVPANASSTANPVTLKATASGSSSGSKKKSQAERKEAAGASSEALKASFKKNRKDQQQAKGGQAAVGENTVEVCHLTGPLIS